MLVKAKLLYTRKNNRINVTVASLHACLSATSGSNYCGDRSSVANLEYCYNNIESIRTWTCAPLWVPDGWLAAQMENSAGIYSLSHSLRNSWESHTETFLPTAAATTQDKSYIRSPLLWVSTARVKDRLSTGCTSFFCPTFLMPLICLFWLKVVLQGFAIVVHAGCLAR